MNEWMRANRRQSLAELCNPKLVRLAQVPHRTADREDPKLARRKLQPPHNMGEPQTENTLQGVKKLMSSSITSHIFCRLLRTKE